MYRSIAIFCYALISLVASSSSAPVDIEERATSCLTCGGCSFKLRASNSTVSYINNHNVTLAPFASGKPYQFAAFGTPGTIFKLDTSCRLTVPSLSATAQVFSGNTNNKNHPVYFQKGTTSVDGKQLVELTCAVVTETGGGNAFTCGKAGSVSGYVFYTARGTQEAGQYEIGQDLLVDARPGDIGASYLSVVLTAVPA